MFVLQRILESDGYFTLLDKNKVVKQNKYFRLFATANTIGLGDTTGLYTGTQQINPNVRARTGAGHCAPKGRPNQWGKFQNTRRLRPLTNAAIDWELNSRAQDFTNATQLRMAARRTGQGHKK